VKIKKKRGGQPVQFPKKQYATRLKLTTIAWLKKQKNAAQTIEAAIENFKKEQQNECAKQQRKANGPA